MDFGRCVWGRREEVRRPGEEKVAKNETEACRLVDGTGGGGGKGVGVGVIGFAVDSEVFGS